ncbi:DUF3040 domain-containing protein [Saccharopolyspora rhizosphaerae]|uniref:DUF3040 domain-containing protein n=1 Tax=Saccharopolyspora rhizosphaerae TaxID=2492662 RepID=A0A3R8PXM8_9PSEU|nr:DUF3040 domain-containing protein [Saccharopolyspora rhizosphaerae]RRO14097.1 DUF3040 domain-containing protein [Saccharopolyspora rhizosphaerae]
MMTQPHERRLLDQIERELRVADPGFAERMTRARPLTRVRAWMSFHRALGVVAAFLALLCLVLGEGAGFIVSGLIAGALLVSTGLKLRTE